MMKTARILAAIRDQGGATTADAEETARLVLPRVTRHLPRQVAEDVQLLNKFRYRQLCRSGFHIRHLAAKAVGIGIPTYLFRKLGTLRESERYSRAKYKWALTIFRMRPRDIRNARAECSPANTGRTHSSPRQIPRTTFSSPTCQGGGTIPNVPLILLQSRTDQGGLRAGVG